ncbi:Asp23/Gls24 family envelope stress response protein [Symbioplanes lichenis]|uniref:Asp23/Gls24 family envelope stress response protein n=1 Tax=Symbioplanes lichenis TaxID=1629072 RepID=UPI00273965A2|nr:Asp23/Gls24 family envelope stress response protein [Actinoplanes lichenis]
MTEEFRADQTQELFLPAVVPSVPPAEGGALVVEAAPFRGATKVHPEVVEKIAAAAARSVPGVAELGGDVARFFNAVLDKVGLDEVGDARRGVSAKVQGTDVFITVVLVIAAGEVVSDVTSLVRIRIIEEVENYGLQVAGVDVKVDDIRMDDAV